MALLGLVAVAVMVFAYVLTSRLNAASMFVGIDRDHNAQVMARAKQALVGWMAVNAAGTDDDPGRLPCPEAPGDFGTVNEGRAAGSCLPPNNVGRLPWRTLGLERLVDAAGEPLWYAVSPAWSKQGAANTVINSDSIGQLTLNGAANDAVALIIAPGAVLSVQAGAGCASHSQLRPASGPPDVRNYLECGNEAGGFVTSAAGQTYNDQVLPVRAPDLIPALEAAIADRMQREIAPALKGVYASAPWRRNSTTSLVPTNPLYPFAASFSDPSLASYKGGLNVRQGLLPFAYSETAPTSGAPCATADPRCDPLFVRYTGGTLSGPALHSTSCTVVTGATTRLDCTFHYTCLLGLCAPSALSYTIQAQAINVGRALRQINLSAPVGSASASATLSNATAVFDTSGGVALTLSGTVTPDGSGGFLGNLLCGLPIVSVLLGCKPSLISVPIGVLADHSLLDGSSTGAGATGWFVRNQWHRLTYYAAAGESTPEGLPSHGCSGSECLQFNGTRNIRALLVLAGRGLPPTQTRPSGSLADYAEHQNADGGTIYEQRTLRMSRTIMAPAGDPFYAPWNDRVVLVDWSSPLVEPAQVIDDNIPAVPLRVGTLLP